MLRKMETRWVVPDVILKRDRNWAWGNDTTINYQNKGLKEITNVTLNGQLVSFNINKTLTTTVNLEATYGLTDIVRLNAPELTYLNLNQNLIDILNPTGNLGKVESLYIPNKIGSNRLIIHADKFPNLKNVNTGNNQGAGFSILGNPKLNQLMATNSKLYAADFVEIMNIVLGVESFTPMFQQRNFQFTMNFDLGSAEYLALKTAITERGGSCLP